MLTPSPEETNLTTPAQPCVPVAALAVDGVAPAAGDAVDFTGQATIDRVENGHAYLNLTTINGEACATPAEPDQDDMMKLAEEADQPQA